MKRIAHRGLLHGPDLDKENNPLTIASTINAGFDCEVDVWIQDYCMYLGHDEPVYPIELQFLLAYSDKLWIHCKNIAALDALHDNPVLNCFWHNTDEYTMTTRGYIWAYPGQPLTKKSIWVGADHADLSDMWNDQIPIEFSGVCSKYWGSIPINKM